MSGWNNKPTDLRAARQRSERAMVISVVIILLVVGGVLIGLIYGWPSILTGLLILIPGAAAVVLLWLVLRALERLSQRDE